MKSSIFSGCRVSRKLVAIQPHQFDVTLGFSLKAPARLNTVQVAVDIELLVSCNRPLLADLARLSQHNRLPR
jgi:hypothetical protein